MTWGLVDSVFTIQLDATFTIALSVVLLLLGYELREKIGTLERFCIPAAVIGGLIMAFILLGLHHSGSGMTMKFDTVMQSPMMVAFFTTVGLGGSLALLKRGGIALIIYLFACWGLAVFQNLFGVGLASALGLNPVLGVMAGAVSLEGGHGAAAAFGPIAEELGVSGAKAVAIASATFGLIAGGLIGGPVARKLIERNKLDLEASKDPLYVQAHNEEAEPIEARPFLKMLMLVLVCMAIGLWVTGEFNAWCKASSNEFLKNFSLPGYVWAMVIAVVFRNLNDAFKFIKLRNSSIDLIANVSIGIFLTMAMMSLRIWDLYSLALPLITILILQTIAIILLAVFILFPLLGKNYDAAVICAGFCGHGLGATPNAVSNMGAVCEHYKVMSHKAFLIVPLCGAVLIDIVALPFISFCINYFAK